MAKIKRRGESGAAKNYTTRNQALKKLQISLSDFRRLCILKGIYPRDPVHKKRANKGSSAPATFYYHKDIQYLLHEPLLAKFREHKAFAKKLARAVGRHEWGLAKNLEEAKPIARLDHIVKERYPTFTLALQDMQDPLNLVHLFSKLPNSPKPGWNLKPEIISECSRLLSEWKVWAIKTHSLRKMFLGIKGIYYECDVPGHGGELIKVRWLEGYEFQQHVPTDVDFRILLTFIELYRTLLNFVLYRLYTEENLVYPPPLDTELDERGETVGAFRLVERKGDEGAKGTVSKKEVKRAIQGIKAAAAGKQGEDVEMDEDVDAAESSSKQATVENEDEDFVERPSKDQAEDIATAPLTTYHSLLATSTVPTKTNLLFSPYTFYLSRETSSTTWEFVIRAMGGKVVTSLNAPDLKTSGADSITHVLVDRPMTPERMREMQGDRKWVWVQPQWVADCVNKGKVIGTENYGPGEVLPPHLSPWDAEGVSAPWENQAVEGEEGEVEDEVEVDGESDDDDDEDADQDEEDSEDMESAKPSLPPGLLASAQDPTNASLLHAAELEAETSGVPHATFRTQLKEATKAAKAAGTTKSVTAVSTGAAGGKEEDLRKIMMSNKKAKLYNKMKYSNQQKEDEKVKLETRRKAIEKRKKKEGK